MIDGSNFYHRLHELNLRNILKFNYKKFGEFLAGSADFNAKYFVGIVRAKEGDKKSEELVKSQQRLFSVLKNHNIEIGHGYILDVNGKYFEKGVDVQIAVDLLVGAYENTYDIAILVSSDTDLIPAIKKARSLRKKIKYIGFRHKPSYGLIGNSDQKQMLSKEDLEKML